MYIRKTLIGGIFSIIFIFAALSVIFRMSFSYMIDNVIETKALVPYVAFEQEYENVRDM
jgi:septation ring formation regulator EzrA